MEPLRTDLNDTQPQKTSIYGNYKVLCSFSNQPILVLGPHYYIFIPSLLLFSTLLLILFFQSEKAFAPAWKVIVFGFIFLFILAYLSVGISNPGLLKKNVPGAGAEVEGEVPDQSYCRFCNRNRPKFTKHCQDCNICIKGYDHHCVWVGKCVGQNNLCRFYTFIFSLGATFIIFFIAVLNSSGF